MAVAMFMEWPGVSQEQYDAVMEELDLDESPAEGALFHMAAVTDEGLRVVDLWESAAAFDAFSRERIMPAVKIVGIDTEPRIEVVALHNVYAPGLDVLAQLGASSMPEGKEEALEA